LLSLPPTLTDLGITKIQSMRWQKFAALPRAEQEAVISAAKDKADRAAACVRAKRPSPTYDEDDGISQAALSVVQAFREIAAKGHDELPAADLPGLLVALRDEMSAIAYTIKQRIKETNNRQAIKRGEKRERRPAAQA